MLLLIHSMQEPRKYPFHLLISSLFDSVLSSVKVPLTLREQGGGVLRPPLAKSAPVQMSNGTFSISHPIPPPPYFLKYKTRVLLQ